ncbi:MAG: hypothetical protein ACLR17_05055 [Enterobacteriaceae bacterium]
MAPERPGVMRRFVIQGECEKQHITILSEYEDELRSVLLLSQ